MNCRSLLTSALVMVAGQRLPLPDWIGPAAADSPKHVWRHGLSAAAEPIQSGKGSRCPATMTSAEVSKDRRFI